MTTADFIIRRVDGRDMDGEYRSFVCVDPDDWTPADEYEHDEPVEYEICRVTPIKRRTFGLDMLCWNCQGEGVFTPPCPVDTDGDGNCAACFRDPHVHAVDCPVCSGTGEGQDVSEVKILTDIDEVARAQAAFASALLATVGFDKANEVLQSYRKIRDGHVPSGSSGGPC